MTKPQEMAEVWARDGNAAVVQLQGRRYPALAIQGQSFWNILNELTLALKRESERDLRDDIEHLRAMVAEHLQVYERALEARGMELPYSKR